MTVDFSKLNSIGDIKNAIENNKPIFTQEEKDLYFTNHLITRNLPAARKVAALLVEIKKAWEEKKANPVFVRKLEDEREADNLGSTVYRVLNVEDLVRKTINYLTFLSKSDFPKDKAAREAKIAELEKELEKKRIEFSELDVALMPSERELRGYVEEVEESKRNIARLEALSVLLGGNSTTAKLKVSGNIVSDSGTEALFSAIDVNIKDYSGANLLNPATRTGTIKLNVAVKEAEDYLGALVSNIPNPELKAYKTDVPINYLNGRRYQTRRTLTDWTDTIGYGVLRALREIGAEKLNKIIDLSSTTPSGSETKDNLKKYVKEIENCIHWHEPILGKGNHYDFVKDGEKWETSYDAWKSSLMKKEKTEYPYVKAVDWEHVFALINSIFPVDTDGKLEKKDYLFKPDDDNYIKRTGDKGWSEIVFLNGYSVDFPVPTDSKAVVWYSQQPGTDPILKTQIKEPSKFPEDVNFASIMQTWHDCFDKHFQNTATNKWKTPATEKCEMDYEFENGQNMLRFCHTMREILHSLGVTSEIDEFDDYLVGIASDAELKVSSEDFLAQPDSNYKGGFYESFYEAVKSKKIWNKDVSSRPRTIKELITKNKARLSLAQGNVDSKSGFINTQREKNHQLINEMNVIKHKIHSLKGLEDLSTKPLSEIKTGFNTLYDKKTDDKWLLTDIHTMLSILEMLKTKMATAGEDYKSEFETKETELKAKEEKASSLGGKIYSEYISIFVDATPNKTDTEGITEILKKKKEEGGGIDHLKKISSYYKDLEAEIILNDKEKASYDKIKEAIAKPEDFKDKTPATTLNEDSLGKILGSAITVDATLLAKIKTIEGQTLSVEKVKELFGLVGADHESKDDTKFESFMSHLGEKENITGANHEEKWKKFLTDKTGKEIVEIIIKHKLEDSTWKKTQEDEMKGKSNIDPNEYSNFDDAGLKKYLFEKLIGQAYKQKPTEDEKDKDKDKDDKKDTTGGKEWYAAYGYMAIWLPASLAAIGGLVYYFWNDIKGLFGTSEESTDKSEENE